MQEITLPVSPRKEVDVPGDDFERYFQIDLQSIFQTARSDAALGVIPNQLGLELLLSRMDAAIDACVHQLQTDADVAAARSSSKFDSLELFLEQRPEGLSGFDIFEDQKQPKPDSTDKDKTDALESDDENAMGFTSLQAEGLPTKTGAGS